MMTSEALITRAQLLYSHPTTQTRAISTLYLLAEKRKSFHVRGGPFLPDNAFERIREGSTEDAAVTVRLIW